MTSREKCRADSLHGRCRIICAFWNVFVTAVRHVCFEVSVSSSHKPFSNAQTLNGKYLQTSIFLLCRLLVAATTSLSPIFLQLFASQLWIDRGFLVDYRAKTKTEFLLVFCRFSSVPTEYQLRAVFHGEFLEFNNVYNFLCMDWLFPWTCQWLYPATAPPFLLIESLLYRYDSVLMTNYPVERFTSGSTLAFSQMASHHLQALFDLKHIIAEWVTAIWPVLEMVKRYQTVTFPPQCLSETVCALPWHCLIMNLC